MPQQGAFGEYRIRKFVFSAETNDMMGDFEGLSLSLKLSDVATV